jgi:outer membrane protein TolC
LYVAASLIQCRKGRFCIFSRALKLKAKTSGLLSGLACFLFTLLIAGGWCTDAIAAPPQILDENVSIPLSLEDAVLLGIRNNRGVQAAYLQRISQKFDLYASEGKFFPKLTIVGSYTSNVADGIKTKTKGLTATATMSLPTGAALTASSTSSSSNGSTSPSLTMLTLTQPLLRNGGIEANTASIRIARIDEQINQLNLRATISQTVVQIVYAYRELLRAQEQKKIAEAALKRSRELYEVNRALISAGRMAEVEIIQTEADVANQEVALEEANNQIDASRLALLNLLALEPSTAVVASGLEISAAKGQDVAHVLAVALENQPDYLTSLLSIERAKINLDYAKNQRLWDVSVVAGQNQAQGDGTAISSPGVGAVLAPGSTSSYAGVQIAVPIGDRSLEQAVVNGSVEWKNQNLRTQDIRQVLEQRIRDAVRNVQTRWRQFELSKKARELTTLKLNIENHYCPEISSNKFNWLGICGSSGLDSAFVTS